MAQSRKSNKLKLKSKKDVDNVTVHERTVSDADVDTQEEEEEDDCVIIDEILTTASGDSPT